MKTEPPPGADRPEALQKALDASYAAQPKDYVPRTHLLQGGRARFVNRLIDEPSPYLRQHAHNPVDWWPWGEAALAEAARLDRPIFLSAGYSTCHWCHVMEEESFDQEDVAALLNAHYIAVKLDREQRPDIDHLYILATSLQHRQAGWPNSVWLLPDGRPFHTGTYFRRPQFIQLLGAIAEAWAGDGRAKLVRFGANLAEGIARIGAQSAEAVPLDGVAEAAQAQLAQSFNADEGGFSSGTQFPHEGYLLFLLDRWRRCGDAEALQMAETSLAAMAAGGFQDHVGGGFHRYTVDVNWRTPHFEKMLYNQALLLRCYTEAHEITARPDFARAAARLVGYLLRDMTAEDGAFYSAEDADSLDPEGKLEEGAFYVWTPEAARETLGDEAEDAIQTLGLKEPPTLEAGPVAHLKPGLDSDFTTLDPLLERLRLARDARPRPLRDDKIIGGWNGLMIRALAEAGDHFARPNWVQAAERAAHAVFARLEGPDGLARMHAAGKRVEAANLTDQVWLAQAALALGDALGDADWTDRATAMAADLLERFGTTDGRLALVREGTPLGPVLEAEDGAVPSGEASALELLAHLDARRPDPLRHARAAALMAALSGMLAAMPVVRLQALLAAETLREGESGFTRISEPVRVRLVRVEMGWALQLTITEGWHIMAGTGEGRSAPALTGAKVKWPTPQNWPSPLGGQSPAYRGTITLPLKTPEPRISLTLQPCSETVCLAPVTINFQVPQ